VTEEKQSKLLVRKLLL